jgi:hypothetical protein
MNVSCWIQTARFPNWVFGKAEFLRSMPDKALALVLSGDLESRFTVLADCVRPAHAGDWQSVIWARPGHKFQDPVASYYSGRLQLAEFPPGDVAPVAGGIELQVRPPVPDSVHHLARILI